MITTTLFGPESRGEVTELAIKLGDEYSLVDYRLTAVVTKLEHLSEASDLVKLGVRSFKVLSRLQGCPGRELRHEHERHLVGLLLPGL